MYLESIFLAGDIRAQLPEEAKKFDAIDKTFKKVQYCMYEECMLTYCAYLDCQTKMHKHLCTYARAYKCSVFVCMRDK